PRCGLRPAGEGEFLGCFCFIPLYIHDKRSGVCKFISVLLFIMRSVRRQAFLCLSGVAGIFVCFFLEFL
ncbi:hypothetical protein, partial [uncultured Cardiobacterium sp.]|uniref:hypothetical protein n=1 Tax=uncultured Cardiobacterium sp. TaxID=417619 RepID=UPI00260AA392